MQKLFLVRHAEPALSGVMLGRHDPPLSDRGRMDAVQKLGSLQVAVTYASPLLRALETARAVPSERHIVLSDLAEIALGEWEGLSWEQIEQRYPDIARRKLDDWLEVTPPGGEPWVVFQRRIQRALMRIAMGPFPAALIGHVAVNAEVARQIAGQDPVRFDQRYCEILEYDFTARL